VGSVARRRFTRCSASHSAAASRDTYGSFHLLPSATASARRCSASLQGSPRVLRTLSLLLPLLLLRRAADAGGLCNRLAALIARLNGAARRGVGAEALPWGSGAWAETPVAAAAGSTAGSTAGARVGSGAARRAASCASSAAVRRTFVRASGRRGPGWWSDAVREGRFVPRPPPGLSSKPSAIEPSAIEPTAIEPSAIEPTAIGVASVAAEAAAAAVAGLWASAVALRGGRAAGRVTSEAVK
jgi:hypothetical protein